MLQPEFKCNDMYFNPKVIIHTGLDLRVWFNCLKKKKKKLGVLQLIELAVEDMQVIIPY